MDIKEIINQRYAMPNASLDRLRQCLTEVSYPKGFRVLESGKIEKDIFFIKKVHIKVFERRMRKVYWLSVTFLILVKSGEDRRRREYDKLRQRNVTYP